MTKVLRIFFARHGDKVALYLVIGLIVIDTLLTLSYKLEMNENIAIQKKLTEIAARKDVILTDLNNIDMSLRGFLLVENEAFIGNYEQVKGQSNPTMTYLETNLPKIGIAASELSQMKQMLGNYFELMDKTVALTRSGNKEEALKILKADHGTAVWETFVKLSSVIDPVINGQKEESQNAYNRLLNMSLVFQIILFAIGIPTLIYTIVNLKRTQLRRRGLINLLDQQNRNLIFDSNQEADLDNENKVIEDIIGNLNKTSTFIKGISQGNYEVKWEGHSKANSSINEHNISGELLIMREQMKTRQEELVRQQWASEGLNKVSEIIRDHQTDFAMLCQNALSFIIKYLSAQQGGLFVLNDDNEDDPHLELVSCYAFNKKKYVTKRVDIGEGILGQIFLEAEPVYLTEVPKDYVTITSGLGELTPSVLTIYPLKQNEVVVALIEIASFSEIDQYGRDFLGNACKSIAASIIAIRSNVKTKILLEKAQQQTEMLRSQEEEMRQNMEELEATQEEMRRREIQSN